MPFAPSALTGVSSFWFQSDSSSTRLPAVSLLKTKIDDLTRFSRATLVPAIFRFLSIKGYIYSLLHEPRNHPHQTNVLRLSGFSFPHSLPSWLTGCVKLFTHSGLIAILVRNLWLGIYYCPENTYSFATDPFWKYFNILTFCYCTRNIIRVKLHKVIAERGINERGIN